MRASQIQSASTEKTPLREIRMALHDRT